MTCLKRSYRELIELTKLYILQEHSLNEKIFSSLETFTYFKNSANKQTQNFQTKEKIPSREVKDPTSTQEAFRTPVKNEELQKPTAKVTIPPSSSNLNVSIQEVKNTESVLIPSEKIINKHSSPIVVPISNNESLESNHTKETPKTHDKKKISLEALPVLKKWDFSEVKKQVSELLPSIQILDRIPEYKAPELRVENKLDEIHILIFNEEQNYLNFFNNIKITLEIYEKKAKIVSHKFDFKELALSKEKPLILTSQNSLNHINHIAGSYRKEKNSHFFYECPLILLENIEHYFQEPSLKISLWKSLKEHLKIS